MYVKTSREGNLTYGEIIKPGARTISLNITSETNLRNTPGNIVLTLLYSDLLMSGSGGLSRDEFQFKLNELGSSITVSATEDKITVSVNLLETKLKQTMSLFELMIAKPSFKVGEFKRAAQTLKNSLEQHKENAKSIALSKLKNSLFNPDSRNYSYDPDTLIKAVEEIKLVNFKDIHALFLASKWIATAGGSEKAVKSIIKNLRKIKPQGEELEKAEEVNFSGLKSKHVITHEVSSKQNIEVSIGGYLPLTLNDSELPAFLFGLAVLGKWGGFSGRLMSTVREKEGLTYGIYAHVQGITLDRAGFWRIMTFFSPKDVVKGVTSTLREVSLIANRGITEKELSRFRTILKTADELVLDSLSATTGLVHNRLLIGQTWDEYKAFREKMYSCTRTEINKVLKEYLNTNTITISTAGPIAIVKKELVKFAN